MRKKKALNERLAWTGTHSRYKKNIKKKKKKKEEKKIKKPKIARKKMFSLFFKIKK